MSLDSSAEREAFEFWYANDRFVRIDASALAGTFAQRLDGTYRNYSVNECWLSWQAARSQPSEWVAISQKTPELHQRVLVLTVNADDEPFVDTANWNGANTGFLGTNGRRLRNANHWMPLPKPPALLPPNVEAK